MEGLEEELERERGVMNQQQQQQQSGQKQQQGQEQQHQPHQPQKCPRCDSVNTKFCYYNNYSLSQPRYFCKSCRRYWTQGGTLRNIPVGGGCRKGKRSSSSSSPSSTKKPSSSSSASSDNLHYLNPNNNNPQQEATMNMNMNMNFSLSTKIPPLMAPSSTNPNSLYYPPGLGVGVGIGTTFLPSIIPFQSYNLNPAFINATGSSSGNQHDLQNIGVSNLALLQGFSFPSYNQNQQIPNMGIREEDQKPILPMEEESNMAGSITSHHHHLQEQQWVQNYNTMNLPISSSESPANYWINNNNNSSALINPGFNPSDLQGFVDVPQNLLPSSCSSSASSSSPSSLL